ncbi:hypothetical protein SELMODRAFT_414237 [Selaginella moellendorffii]|uniref:Uncharacterized protein n=1 Tax=Selaginella moellendorffii TaxID=88036 RepID=D8RS39_SELML|nr:hypothetical protein SELMODRAFT_414237 [Selaginella moellendorffii]
MPAPKLPPLNRKAGRPPIPFDPAPARRRTSRKQDALNRRYQQSYHGLVTNITKCLDRAVPSHSQSPQLKDVPPPCHHRRMCSLTRIVFAKPVPSVPKEDVNPFYAVPHTDITAPLKIHPPSHAMKSDPPPWFGHAKTSVTDPRIDDVAVAPRARKSGGSTSRSKSSLGNYGSKWSKEANNTNPPRCASSLGVSS